MTILTNLPVTSVCGTPQVVTIDKAQFVIDFGIVDAFWSNPANWQEIEFYYVDDTGTSQVKKMSFAGDDYSLNLKTNIYNGNMICKKITLMDGNGSFLAFVRASFPTASEFDFGVSGGYPPAPANIWDTLSGDVSSSGSGQLERTVYTLNWDGGAWHNAPIVGDFTFSGVFNLPPGQSGDTMIGYSFALPIGGNGIANYINTSMYLHGAVTVGSTYGGTPITDNASIPLSTFLNDNTFEIKRVGTLITAKMNGVQSFHEVYGGDVYIASVMQANPSEGYSIVSATLTEP